MDRWQRVATTGALIALLVTGCGEDNVRPTMTYAEADARVERLIREAAAQLPAGAELTLRYSEAMSCEGKNGLEDSGQVFAERSYQITHPDPWPTDQVMDILFRFWETRGYRLHRENRDDPLVQTLYVGDQSDKTSVGIQLVPQKNGTTTLILFGNSECVWEFGTPSQQP